MFDEIIAWSPRNILRNTTIQHQLEANDWFLSVFNGAPVHLKACPCAFPLSILSLHPLECTDPPVCHLIKCRSNNIIMITVNCIHKNIKLIASNHVPGRGDRTSIAPNHPNQLINCWRSVFLRFMKKRCSGWSSRIVLANCQHLKGDWGKGVSFVLHLKCLQQLLVLLHLPLAAVSGVSSKYCSSKLEGYSIASSGAH